MRGDSRRDLYSKTLALFGLGVLAGAGALVDYWPVGVRLPVAASPASTSPAAITPVRASADALTVLAQLLETPRQSAPVPVSTPSVAARPAIIDTYESLPTLAVGFDIGAPVTLHTLPAPTFVNVRLEAPSLPGTVVHIIEPGPGLAPPFPQTVAADSGGGFLTTAFRKTGSSIVRGGVKTGTTLVDAVRVVGNVVRRALPN